MSATLLLLACASAPADRSVDAVPESVQSAGDALKAYYAGADRTDWPVAPSSLPWPTDQALTRIAVASCRSQEEAAPILDVMIARNPDLFLYIGDNVYGDVWSLSPDMEDLFQAYAELSDQADFQRVAAAVPIMAMWDDHDFGMNDAGGSYYGKYGAEAVFETYWGLEDHPTADRDGVYYSQSFGPAGQRVQIIMLDTRFFRTELTRSPNRGAPGM
ncbi:MAG: alkaline phosphatase D family protein, partial [Pseudomonadota bacterium]